MDNKELKGKTKEKVNKKEVRYDEVDSETMKKHWMINEARTGYHVDPIYPYSNNQKISENQNIPKDEEIEYKKFQNLPEGTRAEFIDGKIYYLGTPTIKHQDLILELASSFKAYLHGKSCKVIPAPCEVKIDYASDPLSKITLEPDIVVVCDREKVTEKRVLGAPDLVIEILSPSNADHDKGYKYYKYLSAGVIEYWIVDPEAEEVMVNLLNEGEYETTTYSKGDEIKVFILDSLTIDVTHLFEGYKGSEIKEVEVAREEERTKHEKEKQELNVKVDEAEHRIKILEEQLRLSQNS